MLYYFFQILEKLHHNFAVFHYISLRSILAALTALLFSLLFGPGFIRYLRFLKVGQMVRDDGPRSHLSKTGTPTMGGLLILVAVDLSVLLWVDLKNTYVWVLLFVMNGFAVIGGVDDYRKLVLKNPKGLSAKAKYFWQSLLGFLAASYLFSVAKTPVETSLLIPFFKQLSLPLFWFYPVLAYLVIVGSSNAVNLTDGLDGLAILPTVLIGGALGIFAYVTGNANFANYLLIPYVPHVADLAIFSAALVGAGLGFLWFNTYPAMVFMGDVGSLALGGALGCFAVMIRQEIVFFIMSGVFVAETLSVILQVAYYKLTKRRLLKMAPLHHHFELSGWAEPKVIVRFWIITFILVLLGLSTLKLR